MEKKQQSYVETELKIYFAFYAFYNYMNVVYISEQYV